jgi:hypothetical protein
MIGKISDFMENAIIESSLRFLFMKKYGNLANVPVGTSENEELRDT